jgi:hypothetical protein
LIEITKSIFLLTYKIDKKLDINDIILHQKSDIKVVENVVENSFQYVEKVVEKVV